MTDGSVIIGGMSEAPKPSVPRRRAEDRPGEIVAAALRMFAERGYAATKLEDVARAAGIAKGTVYLYFATKEDLFRAVVRQEILPTLEQFETVFAAWDGPTPDLLRMLFLHLAAVMETDVGGIPKLVLSELGNFPEIAQFYAEEVAGRGIAQLERLLRRGAERGEFRPVPATLLVPVLIGPLLMLLLWRHSLGRHGNLHFDARAVLETHLDLLLRGLAPERAP